MRWQNTENAIYESTATFECCVCGSSNPWYRNQLMDHNKNANYLMRGISFSAFNALEIFYIKLLSHFVFAWAILELVCVFRRCWLLCLQQIQDFSIYFIQPRTPVDDANFDELHCHLNELRFSSFILYTLLLLLANDSGRFAPERKMHLTTFVRRALHRRIICCLRHFISKLQD